MLPKNLKTQKKKRKKKVDFLGQAYKINTTNSGKTNQIKRSKLWQILPNFFIIKGINLKP